MKKVLVMIAVAMLATASFAWISVTWDAYGFFSANDTDNSLYASADAQTKQLVWDLVYTTSDSVATPVFDEKTGDVSYGADTLLSHRSWLPGSSNVSVSDATPSTTVSESPLTLNLDECYLEGGAVYNNDDFDASAGKLYTAVFQYLTNDKVYFAISDAFEVGSWDGSGTRPLPSEVCFDMGSETKIASFLGEIEQPTVIPEPATMSLLGLGALGMVLRRKLRK